MKFGSRTFRHLLNFFQGIPDRISNCYLFQKLSGACIFISLSGICMGILHQHLTLSLCGDVSYQLLACGKVKSFSELRKKLCFTGHQTLEFSNSDEGRVVKSSSLLCPLYRTLSDL